MRAPLSRYYGLDALRACMMLLGIVFHVALPYTGVILPGYYVTDERSGVLQIVLFLHYFRMPTFFLLSGFFSATVWERRGAREFLRLRAKRVGFVWLAALAVLSPVMSVVSIYNHFASEGGNALILTWSAITSLQVNRNWLQEAPLHLWFLEYLFLFCIVAAAILPAIQSFLPVLDRWTGEVIRSRFRTLILALPTAATLGYMPLAATPYPGSFVPWLGLSLTYGWFFTVGWLIHRRCDLLSLLASRTQGEKAALAVMSVLTFILVQRRVKVGLGTSAPGLDIAVALSTGLMIWSAIILLIAFFHHIRPNKWLPYLADASYWIYLAHYPLAVLMPAILGRWPISPVIKVGLSAAFIFLLLLWTYDRFIRYTIVGQALNGVRLRAPVEAAQAAAAGSLRL